MPASRESSVAGAARRRPGAGAGRATERLERLRRRGSRGGIPRQQPGDEGSRRRGSVRHDVRERGRVLVCAAQPDREPVVALERGPAGEQREQDAAERVQVGGGLAVGAARLLGRPVLGCPEQHPLRGHARGGAREPRQPEIRDDDASSRRLDQHVRGRQVTMDDAALVRVGERSSDRPRHRPCLLPRERPAPGELRQAGSLHELHDEERRLAVLAVVVEAHHVLVLERGQHPSLTRESAPQVGVLRDPRMQQLDGHVAVEPLVARPPDRAHAATADAGAQHIAPGKKVCHRGPSLRPRSCPASGAAEL